MKKYNFLLVLVFISFTNFVQGQTPYIDVLTAPALSVYASNIKTEQKNTVKKMTKLNELQAWTATQMVLVNKTQDKIYKGLKEVNGTVQNGLQVTRIFANLTKSVDYMDDVYDEVQNSPEYTVFATKSINTVVKKVADIYTDVADIINDSDTNLAFAGDRRRLLYNIEYNTKMLNIYLITVKLTIQRAKRKGFWKSLNPLENYYNTDKAIFQSILNNSSINNL